MPIAPSTTYREFYRRNPVMVKAALGTLRGQLAALSTHANRLEHVLNGAFTTSPWAPLAVCYDLNDGKGGQVVIGTGLFRQQDNPLDPSISFPTADHKKLFMAQEMRAAGGNPVLKL